MERAWGCRNEILNANKVFLADKAADWKRAGLRAIRLLFTTENGVECVQVLERYLGRGKYQPNDFTRGLYYQHAENGWLCILTVPYDTLLQGVQEILVWYGAGLVLFLIAAVAMWLRDRRLSRTAQRTTETIQVLGNMYYAIYRVNAQTGSFEMTKGL